LSPVADEVSPLPNRLDTSPDESPPAKAIAESVESELSEEELLAAVYAEGVTILFSPDTISVHMSVSSEDRIELVDPLLEDPKLALEEAVVVEELELLEDVPEEFPEPLLEDRLPLLRRLEMT
jgi:hypothetical protein